MADTKLSALSVKATPVDADYIPILDSEVTGGISGATANKRASVRTLRNEQGPADGTSNVVQKPHTNSADTSASSCTIAGGGTNGTSSIDATKASANVIGNGTYNIRTGEAQSSYIAGGADYAAIGGGYDNLVNGLIGVIAGGGHNAIGTGTAHGVIGGGSNNCIVAASQYSTIGGGHNNVIGGVLDLSGVLTAGSAIDNGTICGGYNNSLQAGSSGVIVGGSGNRVTGAGGSCVIVGGENNEISSSGANNIINGGNGNSITGTARNSAIIGGAANTNSADYTFTFGSNQTLAGVYSTVFGESNTTTSTGTHSLVTGRNASGSIPGSQNFTARDFGADGSAQATSFILANQTTDATPKNLSVYGGSTYAIPGNNSCWIGTITLIGRQVGTENAITFKWDFAISKATGNITIQYQGARTALHDDITGLGTPTIDSGTSTFRVNVTGKAATTISWVARVDLAQVTQ